jgi:hypothetical protein
MATIVYLKEGEIASIHSIYIKKPKKIDKEFKREENRWWFLQN